ncbi:MAG: hypothetical protein NT007_02010 [Candidatus Kapabacteria bacterium]|nr:hypothetical protein [Candidatus Kapabacteria bacterium]
MSFLRMQESPSSATLGDSFMRRNDRFREFIRFHTVSLTWKQEVKNKKILIIWNQSNYCLYLCTDF